MSKNSADTLISREPWWALPPKPGQSESELDWGYLEHHAGGRFEFVQQRPTDDEIRNRPGCRLPVPTGGEAEKE